MADLTKEEIEALTTEEVEALMETLRKAVAADREAIERKKDYLRVVQGVYETKMAQQ